MYTLLLLKTHLNDFNKMISCAREKKNNQEYVGDHKACVKQLNECGYQGIS